MNKLTIENFPVVGEKLALIEERISTSEQLAMLVELVLDKAFTEPDFSELYADICLVSGLSGPIGLRLRVSGFRLRVSLAFPVRF